ncbi:MAG: hypothetical protein V4737_16105 [Curtobacterium sp.]
MDTKLKLKIATIVIAAVAALGTLMGGYAALKGASNASFAGASPSTSVTQPVINPSSDESEPAASKEPSTEPSEGISDEPNGPISEPSEPPATQQAAPPAPTLSSFVVNAALTEPVQVGYKVGPNRFQLDGNGAASISFSWSGRMSDGTANESDSCSMLATVTGAGSTFPSVLSSSCSAPGASSFNGSKNHVDIKVPGDYTVTVTDQLTGASGSLTFTVLSN